MTDYVSSASAQTLSMAMCIARAVEDLQDQYPHAAPMDALWLAALALYGNAAALRVQLLSAPARAEAAHG